MTRTYGIICVKNYLRVHMSPSLTTQDTSLTFPHTTLTLLSKIPTNYTTKIGWYTSQINKRRCHRCRVRSPITLNHVLALPPGTSVSCSYCNAH